MTDSSSISRLSSSEFKQLSELVYKEVGINLPDSKKIMLESRLNKRLRILGMASFKVYVQYLTSIEGKANELISMIDEVTTNKTDFFREPHHFEYLQQNILPQLIEEGKNSIRIWSAACSSGEEPYTLAMVMQEFNRINRALDYNIFGSDISTEVLQKAVLAVYSMERAMDIPLPFRQKYLLKSKDTLKPTVRIVPDLRSKVRFGRVNLMDNVLSVEGFFDVIFCRNVLIYFDRKTQMDVVRKLTDKLKPGGYLFIGHSESLYQLDLPITQIKPTIYKKK
jgi:chemotaxis protein methyltransferase CheR